MARQVRSRQTRRVRARSLEPNWALVGLSMGALAVGADGVGKPLWVAWRSGSWQTPYRQTIAGGVGGRQSRGYRTTTPQEALSGANLMLGAGALLLGVVLLWRAFKGPRSIP